MGQSSYKSNFGGIVTILSYSMVFILFIFLGRNFYNRENPTVNMSKSIQNEYFNYTVNSKSFVFAF